MCTGVGMDRLKTELLRLRNELEIANKKASPECNARRPQASSS